MTEERKQDGLKRLAATSNDNNVTRGVQQQLIDSSMAIKQAQRNIQTLTVRTDSFYCIIILYQDVTKKSSNENLLSSPHIRRSTEERLARESR